MARFKGNTRKIYANINDLLKLEYNPRLFSLINLYKIANNIYLIRIDDNWIRGMLFLRCQEYYECVSDRFRNRNFTIAEYIGWYQNEFKNNSNYFSYCDDYAGYNLPSSTIKSCLNNVKDPNQYDFIMKSVYNTIKRIDKKFYLIGLGTNNLCMEHEIAHAFYNIYEDYKKEILYEINIKLSPDRKKYIINWLESVGYCEHVLCDEMQAYLIEKPGFRITFEKYFFKYIYKEEQKISIKWDEFYCNDLEYDSCPKSFAV